MTLNVLSWNIWIKGYFDKISQFLKESDADIIALQEVKDYDPDLDVINYLTDLGYQHVFTPVLKIRDGQIKHRDGPAIFSKYDILKTEIYQLSKNNNRAAVRADIQVQDKILHVFCTHLLHTHQLENQDQNEQATNLIKKLTNENTILMGDFNATPESLVIKKIKKFLIDSNPKSIPTWCVYPEGCSECNQKIVDIRLDYIFVSKDLKVESFEVGNSKGSDHLPIAAVIEI